MTNTKSSNFIVTNTDTAGAISYWRLSGETTLAKLTQAWQAEGLDPKDLPSEPSAEVALRRAIVAQESATRKAFKIKGGDFNHGWGLVDVITTDGHVTTSELIRVRWDASNQSVVLDDSNLTVSSKIDSEIRDAFQAARVTLASTDIGSWLVKLADGKAATSLRDSGGIYFVPRPNVSYWERVARAVQAAGEHRVFRIPALHCDEAVEAILDSITREASDAAEEIEAELVERATTEDGIGDRALESRKARCVKLLDKIRSYETLLGVKLPEIQARIEGLAGSVAAAALAA